MLSPNREAETFASSGGSTAPRTGIRPSTPADEAGIVGLLRSAGLNPNVEPRQLFWKYWQERADWHGSRSFVLCKGNDLLAHAAVIPGSFTHEGRRIRVIHMIDWAASAPVAGVSLMKHVGKLTDALVAVGGSAQTLRILPHIGFQPYGTVTGYARPLRPIRMLTSATTTTAPWRLPPRFLRSAYWTMTAPQSVTAGWRARRVGLGETRALAAALPPRQEGAVSLERNESLFAYMLTCPITPTELYAMEKEGRVRGYFLLAHAPAQVRIADCWLDTDDRLDWCALLQLAVQQSRQNTSAAEVVIWASDPLLAECLEECGFHARNSRPVQMLPSKNFNLPTAVSLRIHMLDSDAAFHHQGIPALWA